MAGRTITLMLSKTILRILLIVIRRNALLGDRGLAGAGSAVRRLDGACELHGELPADRGKRHALFLRTHRLPDAEDPHAVERDGGAEARGFFAE